jgi:uncharacterized protein (DUF1697 family)
MHRVLFLRAANVGGHQRFRPSELVVALPGLGLRSFGAAGTFLMQATMPEARIRATLAEALPFEPSLAVVPAERLVALVRADPFAAEAEAEGARRFLSLLLAPPAVVPALPLERPEGAAWQVRVAAVEPWYALSLRRGEGAGVVYPNPMVERALAVPATTRGWPTIQQVVRALG